MYINLKNYDKYLQNNNYLNRINEIFNAYSILFKDTTFYDRYDCKKKFSESIEFPRTDLDFRQISKGGLTIGEKKVTCEYLQGGKIEI